MILIFFCFIFLVSSTVNTYYSVNLKIFTNYYRAISLSTFSCFTYKTGLLLLLLSRSSRVQLCVTPQTAAHQASLSLGFSRQEYWSGLPFPSPMCESEKWKGSCSVMSDSLRPNGLQPTRLLCPWNFPGKSTGVGCHCLLWILFLCHTIKTLYITG